LPDGLTVGSRRTPKEIRVDST